MASVLILIFQIAGLGLGLYRIWPDAVYLHHAAQRGLTFTPAVQAGARIVLSCSLVLLPFMPTLKPVMGNKVWSALTVLIFAGLSVILALVLRVSVVDGYVFFLTQHRHWVSILWPAAVLVIVLGNWLIAYNEMERVVKVAGK